MYGGRPGEAVHEGRPNVTLLWPGLNTVYVHIEYTLPFVERERPDRGDRDTMQHDARNDAQRALYALLAGAEGCGAAARSARLAQDDELADFLCGVHEEIVGEAKRLLAQRTVE